MGKISLETVKSISSGIGYSFDKKGKTQSAKSTIFFPDIDLVSGAEETYRKRQKANYDALVYSLSPSDSWQTQEEMDQHIDRVKKRSEIDFSNKAVYDSLLDSLNKRKQVYSQYKTAEAYNKELLNYNIGQEFGPLTFDEKEKLLEEKRKFSNEENRAEKIDYLENYALSVGYSTVEDYQKEIDSLNASIESINKHVKFLAQGRIPDSAPGLTDEQIKTENSRIDSEIVRARSNASRLELQLGGLEQKRDELAAARTAEKVVLDVKARPDFEEISADVSTINVPLSLSAADGDLYQQMTEDEKKAYRYLEKTQPSTASYNFFNDLRPILNRRKYEDDIEAAQKFADIPFVSDIVSVGSQLLDGSVMAPIKFIGSLTGDYQKHWASYDTLTNFTTTIRTEHATDLNKLTGWDGSGFVYNTVMSIADMVAAIAVSKGIGAASAAGNASKVAKAVSQVIMSSEAASHTMTDARERGLSGFQIAFLGAASAAIEALTEKYSLDALFSSPKGWKYVVKNVVTEGSEETFSNVLNTLADEVIAGNQSAMKRQIRDYMADGLSYADATQKVLLAKAEEVGLDALGGALSGGIMGGSSAIINYANMRANTVQFAVPSTKNATLADAQAWVTEKFEKQKSGVNVKGLGAVTVDRAKATDAISKTANADQAVMFVALNGTLKKGTVITDQMFQNDTAVAEDMPKVAAIVVPVTLNGNAHIATISTAQTESGQYIVNGITLDGETIYDASTYAKPAQETATSVDAQTAADKQWMQKYGGMSQEELAAEIESREQAKTQSADPTVEDEELTWLKNYSQRVARQGTSASVDVEPSVPGEHVYRSEETAPTALDTAFADMSEQQRAGLIARIESNTGVKIVFDETLDAKGKYKNGVITINPTISTPMTVLKHELTHYLEKAGLYGDLMDFAFDKSKTFKAWMNSKGFNDIDAYARHVVKERAKTKHPLGQNGANAIYEAKQEILADFVGEKLFRDVNALSELAQKKRPLFERIREWFKNLFNRNRGTAMEQELRKMERLFEQAVEQRKSDSPSNDVAGKYLISPSFEKEFDNWDKVSTGRQIKVGTTSEALQSIGVDSKEIYWDTSKIKKIMADHPDMTESVIKQVPNILEEPILIMESKTVSGRLTLFGEVYDVSGVPVLAVLELNPVDKNGHSLDIIKIASAYGKSTNPQGLINSSKILYIEKNKERTNRWLTVNRLQLPLPSTTIGSTDPTISQNSSGVNPYSTQETEKYSPFLMSERKSTTGQSTEQPSGNIDLSTVSTADLRAELAARNPKEGIADIARLQPQDASTTPNIGDVGVRNRKGDGNSAFAENIQATDIFDDQLKELAATNDLITRYDRIANDETMEAANKALNEGGTAYVDKWKGKDSRSFTAKDVAVGFILLSRYQKIGDYTNTISVAQKLREVGTGAGQTVQIFSILSRLTPEGMMAYAQHELGLAWEQMIVGKTRKWVQENKWRAELTAEDCEYIVRKTLQAAALPEGRDKNIRLAEIAGRIQSKIAPIKGQALKAWQRTAMLLNPVTNLRNIMGNVAITPTYLLSDLVAAGLDKTVSKIAKTNVRTKALPQAKAVLGIKVGAQQAFDDFRRSIVAGYKIDTRGIDGDKFGIEGRGSNNFNEHHTGRFADQKNKMAKALNFLDRTTSFLLELGDRPFFEMWFMNSIEGQKKVNGVSEATPEMIEIATQEALQRTWQDDNAVTKFISAVKRGANFDFDVRGVNAHKIVGYGIGDAIVKFTKTPANLAKAIVDFSPLGAVKALAWNGGNFVRTLRSATATQAEIARAQHKFVDNLSKSIVGSLITFAASALAKRGLITGKKDEDKDVADFERYVLGRQPYSVKIGNTYFSYDWAQPTSALIGIAADYIDNKRNAELTGEKLTLMQNIQEAIGVGGQMLFNQSFMKAFQTITKDENFFQNFLTALLSDVSSNIPQVLAQAAKAADPNVRNSYESNDSAKSAWNSILYKLPGARNTLAESVDALGNTKTQYGNDIQRTIASFFSVANIQQGYESKAGEEIYRLYKSTGSAAVIPAVAPNSVQYKDKEDNIVKITLSSHDKEAYQKVSGKTVESAVEKLVGIETYGSLSDENKAKLMSGLYSYAKQKANNEVLGLELDDDAAKAESYISQGIPVEQYFLVRAIRNSDEADLDGSGAIKQDEAQAVLDSTTLTKKQKEILWTSFNSQWKSNPYKYRYY